MATDEVDVAVERALVDSLLEERLGQRVGESTEQTIRRPERSSRLLTAAALIIGAGAVGTAWWLRNAPDDTNDAPASVPQDQRGQPHRPEVTTSSWKPKSREEIRKALGEVWRIRIRFTRVQGMPVKAEGFPPGPLVTIMSRGTELSRFCAELASALPEKPSAAKQKPPILLQLDIANHKHIDAALQDADESGKREFSIGGFGAVPIDAKLVDRLSKTTFLASAETKTIDALGLLHPASMTKLSARAEHLRLHDFDYADLARLSRFSRAKSIDLRFAPKVNDAQGLRVLQAVLSNVETLRILGGQLGRNAYVELVEFTRLRELQVLTQNGSYWGVPEQRDAENVDDTIAPYLLRLTELRSIVVPGASITDTGLASLAELPNLTRLCISGAPRLTGRGFAAFDRHAKLAEVHANGCTGFTDTGLAALAKVPALRQVFLRRVRSGSNVTAAGLAPFGGSQSLTRLELSGWFASRVTAPDRYQTMAKDANGSVIGNAWRQALAKAANAPRLEWLAVDSCPDFVRRDLEFLNGSPIRTLNLGGTVGEPPARIAADALEWIFGRPKKLETIITD